MFPKKIQFYSFKNSDRIQTELIFSFFKKFSWKICVEEIILASCWHFDVDDIRKVREACKSENV